MSLHRVEWKRPEEVTWYYNEFKEPIDYDTAFFDAREVVGDTYNPYDVRIVKLAWPILTESGTIDYYPIHSIVWFRPYPG